MAYVASKFGTVMSTQLPPIASISSSHEKWQVKSVESSILQPLMARLRWNLLCRCLQGRKMVKIHFRSNPRWRAVPKIGHGHIQDAQLSQRDRAAGCVTLFAKSGRLELGDDILRTLQVHLQPLWYNRPENLSNSLKNAK